VLVMKGAGEKQGLALVSSHHPHALEPAFISSSCPKLPLQEGTAETPLQVKIQAQVPQAPVSHW
jgi:hypothetical protein